MELIQGLISGTGDVSTRKNEIASGGLATVRDYIVGYNNPAEVVGGVIKDNGHDFDCHIDSTDNTIVHLTDGVAFAYGYFGYFPATDIVILPPAVEQYHVIYAEFNNSVIPNKFFIKTKNNQSSPNALHSLFRKDQLSTIKTGVFQLPLWTISVTNKGIQNITDLRPLREHIGLVETSPNSYNVADGGVLDENVTAVTPPKGDISQLVATTEFVDSEIKSVIGASGSEVAKGIFYIARGPSNIDTLQFPYANGLAPTWLEWCEGEYNTGDYTTFGLNGEGYVRTTGGILVTDLHGNLIKALDSIINSNTYYMYVADKNYTTTFYIEGVGYQIYIDSSGNAMTWKEWCESEYNTAGFYLYGYEAGYEDQSVVLSSDGNYQVVLGGSSPVHGTAIIDVHRLYGLIEYQRNPVAGDIGHFSVDGEQYEFVYGENGTGPTWQEWLNSSYNTSNLYPNSWFISEGSDKDFIRKIIGSQPNQYDDYYLCETYTQNRTRGVRINETIIAISYFTQEAIPT